MPFASRSSRLAGSKFPASERGPIKAVGKRTPSSSAKARTSTEKGRAMSRNSPKASTGKSTPMIPSNMPPFLTESWCDPNSSTGAPGGPSRLPIIVPAASTFTVRPAFSIQPRMVSRAARCSCVKGSRLTPAPGAVWRDISASRSDICSVISGQADFLLAATPCGRSIVGRTSSHWL